MDRDPSSNVNSVLSPDGQELTIKINGRFDFSCHQDFRDAYERQNQKAKRFVIDLQNTTYMDSSALGMLLLLRDHAGGETSSVHLTNASADTRKILAISNFEKLFTVA